MKSPARHYLVLDGAQIEDLHRQIYELEPAPEFFLLYHQTRYSELADVGPVLVRAEPGSPLETEFKANWITNAGFSLTSAMPTAVLVDHLRSLIHLRTNADVVLLFRYYDPRILRIWLDSLDEAERARVMGPIASIQLPSADARLPHLYENRTMTEGRVYDSAPWLRLDSNQLAVLNMAQQQRFDQRVIEHVTRWFPGCLAGLDEPGQQQWAAGCRNRAAEYGYSSASDVARWAGFVTLLGNDFPAAPEHEIFRTLLTQAQVTPAQRLDNVFTEIQRRLLTQEKDFVA
ncbi:DUF4123 domain-containing protein [Pseudomonas sp.]|uniref:DUF4123 domain-containing protein n=1 Tax=Pseudomonas sp. TaxID=306 RepID=UPI00272D3661|nr:DUF4123 domain-containing protein [Pseudomonas sp.]